MGKTEDRQKKILDILRDNPEKTQEQICAELGVSLRTIKEDYRILKWQGIMLGV